MIEATTSKMPSSSGTSSAPLSVIALPIPCSVGTRPSSVITPRRLKSAIGVGNVAACTITISDSPPSASAITAFEPSTLTVRITVST